MKTLCLDFSEVDRSNSEDKIEQLKDRIMEIEEDMRERPKLFNFLENVQADFSKVREWTPYSIVHKEFWGAMKSLSMKEREIVVNDMIYNLSEREAARSSGLSRARICFYKKRAKEKLRIMIFLQLGIYLLIRRLF